MLDWWSKYHTDILDGTMIGMVCIPYQLFVEALHTLETVWLPFVLLLPRCPSANVLWQL
jgi:hypothetical protein